MALALVRRGFTLALPDSGLVTFRPGDQPRALQFTDADNTALAAFIAANPGAVILDGTLNVDAAIPRVIALRLRGGDPVGYFQASQDLIDNAYVADHP